MRRLAKLHELTCGHAIFAKLHFSHLTNFTFVFDFVCVVVLVMIFGSTVLKYIYIITLIIHDYMTPLIKRCPTGKNRKLRCVKKNGIFG